MKERVMKILKTIKNDPNVKIRQDTNEHLTQAEIDDIILFLKSATQDQSQITNYF